MELEELASRLGVLEADKSAREQADLENRFMDMYGTRFSNDKNIGLAILGEMSRRGIDVSAADNAVQQILDSMRAEATDILNKIQQHESEVSNLVDKVNAMSDSVSAATGEGTPTIPNMEPPAPEAPPAPIEEPAPSPVEEPPIPQTVPSDERLKNIRNHSKGTTKRHILSALTGVM